MFRNQIWCIALALGVAGAAYLLPGCATPQYSEPAKPPGSRIDEAPAPDNVDEQLWRELTKALSAAMDAQLPGWRMGMATKKSTWQTLRPSQ